MTTKTLINHFPLPRPHCGSTLGNGLQGLLVWGDKTLRLTVAHAGFWDHRGGQVMLPTTTFAAVRSRLEADDEPGLRALYPDAPPVNGISTCPQQYGGGRLELAFPDGLRPLRAELDLLHGVLVVRVGRDEDDAHPHALVIRQDPDHECVWVELPEALRGKITFQLIPAFDSVLDNAMGKLGLDAPERWTETGVTGFTQHLPQDPPLTVGFLATETCVTLLTTLGADGRSALVQQAHAFDAASAVQRADAFWADYWRSVPAVTLPDPELQSLYDHGLFRVAGAIRAHAPVATLQGPWMEDTRIPPWSNDYHFNINLQMVYGAALSSGQFAAMEPLWTMLRGWFPRLREWGQQFFGVEGAMLLPHAVDDRGLPIGGMWQGNLDQACVGWTAFLAWQTYEHTLDREFLRDTVWPLLEGAFLGYSAMLDVESDEAGRRRYRLPVSVSPEFGGTKLRQCWGADASFQLACIHALLRVLPQAATTLSLPTDPRWADIATHLPLYSRRVIPDSPYSWDKKNRASINLWEDQDLPESHRHHSHLAALHPFANIEPLDPAHREVVRNALSEWTTEGAGQWAGWSLAWAASLCARCRLPDAALTWLKLLDYAYTNDGHSPLHNADFAGVFACNDGSLAWPDFRKGPDYVHWETMQLDAQMGAVSAITDLLVQVRDGTIYIAERLPKRWRDLSFENLPVPGGFRVSAEIRHRQVRRIQISSTVGGTLRLAPGFTGPWSLDGVPQDGSLLTLPTAPGPGIHSVEMRLNESRPDQSASVLLVYPNTHLCPWIKEELPDDAVLPTNRTDHTKLHPQYESRRRRHRLPQISLHHLP